MIFHILTPLWKDPPVCGTVCALTFISISYFMPKVNRQSYLAFPFSHLSKRDLVFPVKDPWISGTSRLNPGNGAPPAGSVPPCSFHSFVTTISNASSSRYPPRPPHRPQHPRSALRHNACKGTYSQAVHYGASCICHCCIWAAGSGTIPSCLPLFFAHAVCCPCT